MLNGENVTGEWNEIQNCSRCTNQNAHEDTAAVLHNNWRPLFQNSLNPLSPCSVGWEKFLNSLSQFLNSLPAKLKESAYISLVRSILEYAASVWDPHLAKDINKLENIQRRSARFVKGDYRTTSSVTQMLQELGWQDLQSRRRDLRLALLF